MGSADVIPGVSGGTVALIVGIYGRLILALSHFDAILMRYLRRGDWRLAAKHIDLRFLIALGIGVLVGAISLGGLIERLLTNDSQRAITLATFFGMILASIYVVARLIPVSTLTDGFQAALLTLLAAAAAFWITGLPAQAATPGPFYVFFCGVIGICAMILPGISGAYLLIFLGLYPSLTDILHRARGMDLHVADLQFVVLFGLGCTLGLLLFSKVLWWLLVHHQRPIMAILCGLMMGGLRKVWPFQTDLSPHEEKLRNKIFSPFWPDDWDTITITAIVAAVAAMVLVLVMQRIAHAGRGRVVLADER